MRHFAPQLYSQLFGFFLLLFVVSVTNGQIPIQPVNGRKDIQQRQWELTNMGRRPSAPAARVKQVPLATLREDFSKLQVLNNELVKQAFVQTMTKPKEIRSSLAEIRKVAQRLKDNFNLPESKDQKNSRQRETQLCNLTLTPGVLLLDKTVASFVENPFFQQPKVLDMELVFRAGGDLDEILRLSKFLLKLTKEEQTTTQPSLSACKMEQ